MTLRYVAVFCVGSFVGWHAAWIGMRFALARRPDVADKIQRRWGTR